MEETSAMSRPKISRAIKRRLVAEAGGKCANPGCANVLTEIHHIREWHVVQTHDPDHMIALCPTCHEAVSRGDLRVTDAEAYEWKATIRADPSYRRAHLYVETGPEAARVLLGSIVLQGASPKVVLLAGRTRQLSFTVNDLDIMQLNAKICDNEGTVIAHVVDGHVAIRTADPGCTLEQRPGYVRVQHPLSEALLSSAQLEEIRKLEPGLIEGDRITLLEMRVVAPNVVDVVGFWLNGDEGVYVGEHAHIVKGGQDLSLVGEGMGTTIIWAPSNPDAAFFNDGPFDVASA